MGITRDSMTHRWNVVRFKKKKEKEEHKRRKFGQVIKKASVLTHTSFWKKRNQSGLQKLGEN